MTENIKEKIRPIYKELQGYLLQVPLPKDTDSLIDHPAIFEQLNKTIDELNACSGDNYDKFKVSPHYQEANYQDYSLIDYRQKIGGLISRLHAEYFSDESDEPEPFSGSPSTIITQNQQQSQSVNIQMLLEIQGLIDKKLPEFKEGSKGKKFLQKVREPLPNIKSAIELIRLILSIAGNFGLTLNEVAEMLRP